MEIRLDNVSYSRVINNFSYVFKEGSITSIIGRNGTGKSILGLILMDVIDDYEGRIVVNENYEFDIYDYLKLVGYVSQKPDKHFVCETVKEEIAFGLKNYNYKLDKMDEHIKDSLKMVGLSNDYLDRSVMELSASEKTKVAIASSLVMNPEVLILDDITFYLDNNNKKELLNLLLKLKDKFNKTIILISSDIDFVYSLGNDYILMDEGNIVKKGKVKEFLYDNSWFDKYGFEIPKVIKFVKLLSLNKKVDLTKIKNIDDIVREVMIKNG